MKTYYLLVTDRIIDDSDLKLAFEIANGCSAEKDPDLFGKWKSSILHFNVAQTYDNVTDKDIETFVNFGAPVLATMAYRDLHGCSLMEAKEHIDKLRGR